MDDQQLFGIDGPFFVGCNYWASHAGTAMWSDWSAETVALDLQRVAEAGIQVMRVFPLWPDFQPITTIYTNGGRPSGQRHGEERLGDSEIGRAGMSQVMMERFMALADMAHARGIRLIVGLITGYMSSRLFVPPALQGRDILTDPEALRWQLRFVDYFVRAMKGHPAIAAWDLGNECNCISDVATSHQAYAWTSGVANAIRRADPLRLVVSGMHSLSPTGTWTMQDQGELTDVLTTHPYPFWTEYMDYDPVDSMRPCLHATVESLFYGQLGRRPCFAEEMGTMGPMVCSEEVAAAFARTSLLSQWAHGLPGLLWWCASDQRRLRHSPYDSTACENELGLITEEGRVKPVLTTLTATRLALAALPFARLPQRQVEAVCVLNSKADHWAVALGSFLLAKQGGFDLQFVFEDQALPEAPLYLLPCVTGVAGVPKQLWEELLARADRGATLYVSTDNGYLLDFPEVTGLEVANRRRRTESARVILAPGQDGGAATLEIPASFRLDFTNRSATLLAAEEDGNPVWSSRAYGRGRVHFFALPLELAMSTRPGISHRPEAHPLWKVYARMSEELRSASRVLGHSGPLVACTEHVVDGGRRVAVLINHKPSPVEIAPRLRGGWRIAACHYGAMAGTTGFGTLRIGGNDALVLELLRA